MEVRPLDASAAPGDAALALAGLIGHIGDPAFGARGIEHLNRLLPLGWWTVYRLFDDDAPPRLLAGGHLDAPDCVADSFGAYRAGLYRDDLAFLEARERVRAGTPVTTHLHARELRREHRRRIYERHGLAERLSVLGPGGGGAVLAVNLYRRADQPPTGETERERFRAAAALLLACVGRHLALAPAAPLDALPRREREVCERLLRGWTHDGIAADLGVAASTVKTYRDRAFERLGIRHRHELFALALREASAG